MAIRFGAGAYAYNMTKLGLESSHHYQMAVRFKLHSIPTTTAYIFGFTNAAFNRWAGLFISGTSGGKELWSTWYNGSAQSGGSSPSMSWSTSVWYWAMIESLGAADHSLYFQGTRYRNTSINCEEVAPFPYDRFTLGGLGLGHGCDCDISDLYLIRTSLGAKEITAHEAGVCPEKIRPAANPLYYSCVSLDNGLNSRSAVGSAGAQARYPLTNVSGTLVKGPAIFARG